MDISRSGRLYEHLRHHSSRFRHVLGCFCCFHRKGATLHKPKFSEALRTGLIFGAIETLTPLIGWGWVWPSQFVLEWNHWIAFVLLVFLGGRMVIEGFRGNSDEDEEPQHRHGFWLLVTTAIATSLTRWPSVLVWPSCR